MTDTGVDEQPQTDELRQGLLERLTAELEDGAILGSEIHHGELVVRVRRDAWRRTAEVCKTVLGFDQFTFLSGIDWMPNPGMSGEKAFDAPEGGAVEVDVDDPADAGGTEMTSGAGGGDSRFQVFARLYDVRAHVGITLKADLDEADPRVDSWVPVFRGADWHERETWEMYGFTFDGHPSLRHIYLPSEFEGFPLRKDFPLLAREVKPWPGIVDVEQMPGGADEGGEAGEESEG